MFELSAILIALATACVVPDSETQLQVALAYEAFDSREAPYGWRALNAAGCTDAALAQLAEYAAVNQPHLSIEQQMEISFHGGQVLAFAGREKEAIAYFEQAIKTGAAREWQTYVEATLAFLRHDAAALAAARSNYAAVAPGSMRLGIIDGFIACADKPYREAVHCGM